ncbi:hypothetical protein Hanom_Chr16g01467381 [Helianthus anomalus]
MVHRLNQTPRNHHRGRKIAFQKGAGVHLLVRFKSAHHIVSLVVPIMITKINHYHHKSLIILSLCIDC